MRGSPWGNGLSLAAGQDKPMINLLNYTLPELTDWMQTELGEPKFRAVQVWQWIWQMP